MKGRIGVALMAVLLLLYLGVVIQLSFRLIAVDEPIAKGIGIALLILPLIGIWALVTELLFGLRSQRLATIVAAEGDLPADGLPLRASGRPVRSAADVEFPRFQAAVEADPQSWGAWFRLGLAYDACGDRRRARSSIRTAIALHRG
ncbi:MAG: hypothetical protein H7146_01480 [Burkholderiaceae bacterium]|nr:hypothetical protein [Microbacteriaceae bacterium]